MRISSAQFNQLAVQNMLNQQAQLSKTQNQVATGKRVNKPSDDPVASVQIGALTRAQAQNEQFGKNSTLATNRLNLEEQALTDSNTVLQRTRELVIQANSATLSDADRQSIATELKARQDELLAIANRKDSNGEYLFAGLSTTTQPFVRGSTGSVQYQGDTGGRSIQVDAAMSVQDSDPGSRIFMDIAGGNGVFRAAATGTNTGSGIIDAGSVVNRAAWVPDNYTISFTSSSDWRVTNGAGTQIAAGTYTGASGSTISFNGVQVGMAGTPAAGDSFTVSPGGTRDIFSTMDGIIAALQGGAGNNAQRAQFNSAMNASLQQLDQTDAQFNTVHSQIGARLSTLGDMDSARANQMTDLQSAASQLTDLDYAASMSKMSQQLLGLQAAQQSYTLTAKLSLFNYL
jgi:flagellar hook-associated protein 3 FlgL